MNDSEKKQSLALAEHYFRSNNHQFAEHILNTIIKIDPNNSKANEFLAYIYGNKGDSNISYQLLEKSCAKEDCSPEALYYLGSAQLKLNLYEKAVQSFKQSIEKAGVFFEALHDLGTAYCHLGEKENGLLYYKKALNLKKNSHELFFNMARVFDDLKLYEDALDSYDKAIKLKPDFLAAWKNQGTTLVDLNRYEEALLSFDQAISLQPNDYVSLCSKAAILLVTENFEKGWDLYENRWEIISLESYRHPKIAELKSLKELQNKQILVWHEQGLGDSIQFSRYISKLIDLGANVTFEVQKPLLRIFTTQKKLAITSQVESHAKFDFQVPLLSLPKLFNTSIDSIPNPTPIQITPEDISNWKKKLNISDKKLNIGLAISGNPNHKNDSNRSMKLNDISPLFDVGEFFLLQKEINRVDLDNLNKKMNLNFLGDDIDDFVDTASIIMNMDLIISVDTSLIHLAGSLNKRSYLMLPWCPEWRWLLDRSDSPWYPSIKIFRQKSLGDWNSVIEDIKAELSILTQQ